MVVTGMGGLTSLGDNYDAVEVNLRGGLSGVRTMPEWDVYEDLQTRLGAPLTGIEVTARDASNMMLASARIRATTSS